jgi:hypothetical protein
MAQKDKEIDWQAPRIGFVMNSYEKMSDTAFHHIA